MKIHIVKKGDTLWEIANNYNVDFEQLKTLNPQLSSPDMIMPGMKIKIPSDAKPVKKESMVKEKEMIQTPYKDMSPKPLPVIKEDEKEEPMMKQPKPPMHQMPMMEQDMNQFTTINFSQMPPKPVQKNEANYHHEKMQPMPQPQYMPMVPLCCYPMHPCGAPMPHGEAPMHMMPQKSMPMPMPSHQPHGCGCEGGKPSYQHPQQNMNMYQEMPKMEMPSHQPHGCGCEGGKPPYHHPQQNMNMYQEMPKMEMPSHQPHGCGCEGEKSPYHHPQQNMNMYQEMPELEMPKKPKYEYGEDCDDKMVKPKYYDKKWNDMTNHQYSGGYNQGYPQMNMSNPYPTPPGFQPFPTAPFRDDEDENNNEE